MVNNNHPWWNKSAPKQERGAPSYENDVFVLRRGVFKRNVEASEGFKSCPLLHRKDEVPAHHTNTAWSSGCCKSGTRHAP
eukprot:1155506-Pelagomonas_calceolata.AAC.7